VINRIIAIIVCLAILLTLCPCAYSQSDLQRGDEFRIETHGGTILQGELQRNDGHLLSLWSDTSGRHTIALSAVKTVFRVKRYTVMGGCLGSVAGIGLGMAVVAVVNSNRESEGLGTIGSEVGQAVGITIIGGIIGGIVGVGIGRRTQRLDEVPLEALPLCFSPSGDTFPIKVSFVINF
jgi:hypothetical protein